MISQFSISSIFEATKNMTPTGDTLHQLKECHGSLLFGLLIFVEGEENYQMTQPVIIMVASLNETKKLRRGLPFDPNRPKVIPSTVEKTTRPRILVASS